MKTNKSVIILLFLILWCGCLAIGGTERKYKQMRTHEHVFLPNGEKVEYTMIYIHNKDDAPNFKTIVLLDLKDKGRWIYEYSSMRVPDKENEDWPYVTTEKFLYLETKECIEITWPKSSKLHKFVFKINGHNEIHLKDEEIPDKFESFISKLKNPFSKIFLAGLLDIKDLSFLLPKINAFPISYESFYPLGFKKEVKDVENKENQLNKYNEVEKNFREFENVNCDFDAQFGYPCTPEEVPAKNPKILVIEKKQ